MLIDRSSRRGLGRSLAPQDRSAAARLLPLPLPRAPAGELSRPPPARPGAASTALISADLPRTRRRGQLKSFKESVGYLKKGGGIFAFPEGTRSRNGRLMPFKGGVFSCAPP